MSAPLIRKIYQKSPPLFPGKSNLDATDDPLYGDQEGRHFHGYYDCCCYLPLYVFCGRHLLAAKLRSSANDAADGAVQEVARTSVTSACNDPAPPS
jgi:hypothetical protein